MLWVLKITVSTRWFGSFEHPKNMFKLIDKENKKFLGGGGGGGEGIALLDLSMDLKLT